MNRPMINDNGTIRPMSDAEIAEMERLAAEMPVPEPTPEEWLAALEKALAERDAMILELMSNNN